MELYEKTIYPTVLNSEFALFKEHDGKLYIKSDNVSAGGGPAMNALDYTQATIQSKTADSFEVVAPMLEIDGNGTPFTYKVIRQDGLWVLDSFASFS